MSSGCLIENTQEHVWSITSYNDNIRPRTHLLRVKTGLSSECSIVATRSEVLDQIDGILDILLLPSFPTVVGNATDPVD
jgi:hypothetical protein